MIILLLINEAKPFASALADTLGALHKKYRATQGKIRLHIQRKKEKWKFPVYSGFLSTFVLLCLRNQRPSVYLYLLLIPTTSFISLASASRNFNIHIKNLRFVLTAGSDNRVLNNIRKKQCEYCFFFSYYSRGFIL